VIGISSDVLYPVAEGEELARSLGNGEFAVLDEPQGHDAFLIETDRLNDLVLEWLFRSHTVEQSAAREEARV
jgi:homoserine O-acetyltransferase